MIERQIRAVASKVANRAVLIYEQGHISRCGGEAGQVCIWDVGFKEMLHTLRAEGQGDLVLALDAHPSRDVLVTGAGGAAPGGEAAADAAAAAGAGAGAGSASSSASASASASAMQQGRGAAAFALRWWSEPE